MVPFYKAHDLIMRHLESKIMPLNFFHEHEGIGQKGIKDQGETEPHITLYELGVTMSDNVRTLQEYL